MMNHKWIPCILKHDAVERGLVPAIVEKLSEYADVLRIQRMCFSREDVEAYKNTEWSEDPMGFPEEGLFRECILEYEAQDVVVLKIRPFSDVSLEDLKDIKGRSFLPHKCGQNSIRGFFADPSQVGRLKIINHRIFEILPDGRVGFPRNIIHIPDSDVSVHALITIISLHWGECR